MEDEMEQSKRLGDSPVFPIVKRETYDNGVTLDVEYTGLSKREHFAGLALQGLTSTLTIGRDEYAHVIAITAVKYADALLKQLEER
jgi:hypothetical protein